MYDCMGEAVIKQYFWGPLSICCMSTRFITDKKKMLCCHKTNEGSAHK